MSSSACDERCQRGAERPHLGTGINLPPVARMLEAQVHKTPRAYTLVVCTIRKQPTTATMILRRNIRFPCYLRAHHPALPFVALATSLATAIILSLRASCICHFCRPLLFYAFFLQQRQPAHVGGSLRWAGCRSTRQNCPSTWARGRAARAVRRGGGGGWPKEVHGRRWNRLINAACKGDRPPCSAEACR